VQVGCLAACNNIFSSGSCSHATFMLTSLSLQALVKALRPHFMLVEYVNITINNIKANSVLKDFYACTSTYNWNSMGAFIPCPSSSKGFFVGATSLVLQQYLSRALHVLQSQPSSRTFWLMA
jgi:hypothetical protein